MNPSVSTHAGIDRGALIDGQGSSLPMRLVEARLTYFVNWNWAVCVVPSVNLRESWRHVPAQVLSVFHV